MITATHLEGVAHVDQLAKAAALSIGTAWRGIASRLGFAPPAAAGGADALRDPVRDPVREAAAVRELALRYRASDPGFAADLLAAADRHERSACTG